MSNTAQRIHAALGIPTRDGSKQAHGSKNASATKSGPGRFHSEGASKATPPKSKGAAHGFTLHQASDEKKNRRALVKVHGRRQAIKATKYWRAEDRYAKKLEADERAAYAAHDDQPELA